MGVFDLSEIESKNPLIAFAETPKSFSSSYSSCSLVPSIIKSLFSYCWSSSICLTNLLFIIDEIKSETVFLSMATSFTI